MSDLKTNFAVSPYHDDYDPEKKFHRILFRPATPVQARELTQLQTILQQQISRMGDHVFKDGSVVSGCHVTYRPATEYVTLRNQFTGNTLLSVVDVPTGYMLVGNTSGVRAAILTAIPGFEDAFPNSNRFYVQYLSTGANDAVRFIPGEYVNVYDEAQPKFDALNGGNFFDSIQVVNEVNAVGQGYSLSIGSGVVYSKGFFVLVTDQTLVVREFDQDPTGYRVGFDLLESIVTEDVDESLNDPSLGYPNETAPGAHRLALNPTLVAKHRNQTANSLDFFAIVEFDDATPTEQNTDQVYNKLGEEFARRSAEDAGDYVYKPFTVETFPGKDANTKLYDANLFAYSISTGIGYVQGYRVEKIGTSNVVVPRAYSYDLSEGVIATAGYGNYVVVDEFIGQFDFEHLTEVELYDAAQNTITDGETATSPTGNVVGWATIRHVEYYQGVKGTADCQYLLYLNNVRMAPGKSFASDVKSVYDLSTARGAVRADVVLSDVFVSNNSVQQRAQMYDTSKQLLVFPMGARYLKSHLDEGGDSDTQYVFTATANATLQTNGYIAVSLNPAGAGATEKVNATGSITLASEKANFDVVLTGSAVLTTNLAGTVSVNTSSPNVVGTGTSFSTQFKPGERFRYLHQSGNTTQVIAAVTNTTHMVLVANAAVTNSSANYQKAYLQGSHVDMSPTSANITVISNTTFGVQSGLALNVALTTTSTVTVTYPVLRTDAYPLKANASYGRLVKIDCSNNVAGAIGPWELGHPFVYKLESVYVGSTYDVSNADHVDWFSLDDGQRDSEWSLARLVLKPQFQGKLDASSKLLVQFSALTVSNSQGVGFMTVDSYPTSNSGAPNSIEWREIPRYTTSSGQLVDLRDCVDFRPSRASTANLTNVLNDATINPSGPTLNAYGAGGISSHFPSPDENFQSDVFYYRPRIDLILVNKMGDFTVLQGEPSLNPRPPRKDNDTMLVATATVPAWPSLTTREAEESGRFDLMTRVDIRTNRNYSKRDIGVIDQRLKIVEYYMVLNAVEQKARDFQVQDVDGLDRFKNGIFADPFNSHALGEVTDFEYRIAIDERVGVARPYFREHQVDYAYDSANSTTQRTGNYVVLPYTHEEFISQGFASKFRNCSESIWNWSGRMQLHPPYYAARSTTALPNQNVVVDLSQPWEEFANSPFGTNYGEWQVTGTVTQSNVSSQSTSNSSGVTNTTSTTITTATTSQRVIQELQVATLSNKQNVGTYVTDVSLEPYMKGVLIGFEVTNMKPNTKVYAFFDNVNVSEHCAPAEVTNLTSAPETREGASYTRTAAWGTQLVTDSVGSVTGLYRLPENTFRTGDRVFMLVDVDDLETGANAVFTRAAATFTASAIAVSTQSVTLTTIEPQLSVSTIAESNTVVSTSTSVASNFTATANTAPPVRELVTQPRQVRTTTTNRGGGGGAGGGVDPIAQSFMATIPSSDSGCFVTKLDLYFKSKDPSMGVTVAILEMRLGFPDRTRVLAQKHLTSAEVTVSDDATEPTTFEFPEPVFLTADQDYAFIVKPDGDSPDYKIWAGETGQYDVQTGIQIFQNPYAGVMFVSANMNTWTAVQIEDIKFTMYRAKFQTGTQVAYFHNEDDEFLTFEGLVRANASVAAVTGDAAYTGNSVSTNTAGPSGVVQRVDELLETVQLDSSNGGWSAGQVIKIHNPPAMGNASLIAANNLVVTANVVSVDDLRYHAVVPRFGIMAPSRTQVDLIFRGASNTGFIDSGWHTVVNDVETELFDYTRSVYSRSNETALGGKSVRYELAFSSESEWVSPVVDLRRKSGLHVENLINASDVGEANSRYGEALSKYVSQVVTLADGQEAEDLIVHVTAHRPVGTTVKVYARIKAPITDDTPLNTRAWTELTQGVGTKNFTSTDPKDFLEFEYTVPAEAPSTNPGAAYINADTGIIEANVGGQIDVGIKQVQLKIVLLSENAALVPRLSDVRMICLQA